MPEINREKERKLTADRLRSLVSYDSETGVFTWRVSRRGAKAGEIAGSVRADGRRLIRIDYERYLASRLAWLYVYGEWPSDLIDHIDRNHSNDAISNLRQATSQQNHWNSGVRIQNPLGLRNITKHKKRFVVRFFNGRTVIYRESFPSLEDAVRERDERSRVIYGAFHPSSSDL
jgi:hypothetical protein